MSEIKEEEKVHNKELEDKYEKKKVEKAKPAEAKQESLMWLQLELTRFFGFFALLVMSIMRLMEASILDCRPIAAQFIFPLISLKFLDNKWLGFVVIFCSQLGINFLIFPNFNKQYHDIAVSAGMCVWFFVMSEFIIPNLGLEKKSKGNMEKALKAKKDHKVEKPVVHIVYHILFNILSYMAIMQIVINNMGLLYSPVHCHEKAGQADAELLNPVGNSTGEASEAASGMFRPHFLEVDCHYETVNALQLGLSELYYVFTFIFLLGPLRLFLKIKEGKTSVAKLAEDYEDSRGVLGDALARNQAQNQNRGLLPTTTRPNRRTQVQEDSNNETEHM